MELVWQTARRFLEQSAMKQTDKLLLSIVAGIFLLVAAAFILVLTRPAPEYQPNDSPEHIAHNYLLALRQQAYERAYSYLSPELKNYPDTLDKFIGDVEDNTRAFRLDTEVSLDVASVRIVNNEATVTIEETRFYNSDLFNSSQSTTTFMVHLSQVNGAWRITQSSAYWDNCWLQKTTYCP
jgi:hypothetical protein